MTEIEDLLKVNIRQKEFYDSEEQNKRNFTSRIWAKLRNGLLSDYRAKYGLKDRICREHMNWLGDLKTKKVLDLGCNSGNSLSLQLAKAAREYVGIDLSEKGIAALDKKLRENDCSSARAIAVDFFSPDFVESDFDVIYAFSVLHHFENLDLLIERLNEKLASGGVIISYDPLETSKLVKFVRVMYRPFQSDKDWEWPFNKKVLKTLSENFEVCNVHGFLGMSKFGLLLDSLPFKSQKKVRMIENWIERDWEAGLGDRNLYSCMHITMKLKKKPSTVAAEIDA